MTNTEDCCCHFARRRCRCRANPSAREHGVTQIVIGHPDRSRWQEFLKGSLINRITRELHFVDILIVASK